MITKKLFYVFGMRHSGLHAISEWILRSIDGNCSLFNSQRHDLDYLYLVLDNAAYTDLFFPFKNKGIHSCQDRDAVVILYEDQLPAKIDYEHIERVVGMADVTKPILLLRDPYNMAASRIKAGRNSELDTWIHHAQAFLDTTNIVCINFNKWFTDVSYRCDISQQLDIAPNKHISSISPHGRGSSFDGRKYQGRAQDMDLLNRWKHIYHTHPDIFENKTVKNLSSQIFSFIPKK